MAVGLPGRVPRPVGRLVPLMGIFDKILRSGEGRKLKALQSLTPDITALEPEMEALSRRRASRARPPSSASASTTARTSTTSCSRRSRWSGRPASGSWASATTTCS